MNRKIPARKLIIGLITVFLLSLPKSHAQQSDNIQELSDVQQIIAVVNDSPISLYDLKQRVLLFMISSGARQFSQEEQQYLNQQALQSLVDDKLKIQEADKYKTVISKEEQEQSFLTYAQQMRITPEQLEQQLNQAGIRKESMLKQVEATLAWEQVVGGLLMPQVSISDEEIYSILERMESNKGQFEYHPLEIFLLVSENDKRDNTRIAANRIVEQLNKEASFQLMARQFSQSTTSAVGGDLGWLTESQLSPEISSTLKNMKKGEISAPIETEDGFYILQLAGKRQILTANKTDAKVELQHLFFEVSDKAQDEELAALERTVAEAVAKIENCENLEQQGKELGAKQTGSLGNLAISELPESLHQPLLNLEVGHATPPIREPEGYRVFVVCDRKDPEIRLPDYDSVEGSLSQQRVGLIARRHLRDLRRDAIIDYK
ncbi:Periplasmic chaperone and peptidyl-prolyl cis-trans isomerase of outer membrane proteins SurA [hydrothermal vent metagenome]|uniref:Periplasmic chaperone and peptidyl-prolyl cis-trans isomerase of outer membrane proteins SurA n=1 Tax=hydrothermal vent metagenome TaxID=652676 RepID=A0A3B0SSH0_9ZZZZ